ncbi:hypothetical protein GCM10007854_03900 [Algimonas porphyrae]|uniref:Uncharacterized protein n=1 Tax=Algimonas porphyrae TaxID=1128113 RepID=A0ABQ5UXI0_9PROT|nr:hypothetical protein GCM10007854_03900 [Algimonas porphyrae]
MVGTSAVRFRLSAKAVMRARKADDVLTTGGCIKAGSGQDFEKDAVP